MLADPIPPHDTQCPRASYPPSTVLLLLTRPMGLVLVPVSQDALFNLQTFRPNVTHRDMPSKAPKAHGRQKRIKFYPFSCMRTNYLLSWSSFSCLVCRKGNHSFVPFVSVSGVQPCFLLELRPSRVLGCYSPPLIPWEDLHDGGLLCPSHSPVDSPTSPLLLSTCLLAQTLERCSGDHKPVDP